MQIFLSAFDDVPDPRASNARHDLGELLVIAFVSVLCGSVRATSRCCAAALWMSSDATRPKALSASNSSKLAGMRNFYAAFSMCCKEREPNAIALTEREHHTSVTPRN
jgi:hypothetical protein